MVFILLASIQGSIVTENVINCTFSDRKFHEKSYGNIHILVHLFWASFEFLCTHVTHFMFPFLSMTFPIYSVL